MHLILAIVILSACFLSTACSGVRGVDNKPLSNTVKSPPLVAYDGKTCPVYEDELLTLDGKNSFSECEVRKNPNIFDGKTVRIKSGYGFMIHGGYFIDREGCAELSRSIDQAISPGFSQEDFDHIFSFRGFPVDIVAVGKFTVSEPARKSDAIAHRTPYHFEAVCLEKAAKRDK